MITSKLLVRTLVVLIGLGIFVRGIWLWITPFSDKWYDSANAAISALMIVIVTVFCYDLYFV